MKIHAIACQISSCDIRKLAFCIHNLMGVYSILPGIIKSNLELPHRYLWHVITSNWNCRDTTLNLICIEWTLQLSVCNGALLLVVLSTGSFCTSNFPHSNKRESIMFSQLAYSRVVMTTMGSAVPKHVSQLYK
jgi:hypothetical protein